MGVWKDILKAGVRWLVNIVLGWLVLKGVISEEESTTWSGEIVAGIVGLLITLGWAWKDKIKSWVFGKFARIAPANTPPQEIKTEVNALSVMEQFKEARTATAPEQEL